jgi:hypothetical protein
MKETLKQIFIAPDGKLRAIWRATIYHTVGTFVFFPLLDRLFALATQPLHLGAELSAANIGLGELRNFFKALICTGVFAWYEGRRVDSYGLPLSHAFRWQTFEGAVVGLIMAGVALGMTHAEGGRPRGYSLDSIHLRAVRMVPARPQNVLSLSERHRN